MVPLACGTVAVIATDLLGEQHAKAPVVAVEHYFRDIICLEMFLQTRTRGSVRVVGAVPSERLSPCMFRKTNCSIRSVSLFVLRT